MGMSVKYSRIGLHTDLFEDTDRIPRRLLF